MRLVSGLQAQRLQGRKMLNAGQTMNGLIAGKFKLGQGIDVLPGNRASRSA